MAEITRTRLAALGLSRYQVSILTKQLKPKGKSGRSKTFLVSEIVEAIRRRIQTPRIRKNTKRSLNTVLNALLEQLGNVVPLPQSEIPKVRKAGAKLLMSIAKTDATKAAMSATALEINTKYVSVDK
jgi:hypothetical protein